jgi:phosphoglycerate-specific signal transduction histidine kinase
MKEPIKPINEALRQEELESFNILGSSPQVEYDEITLLASTICKTPSALVSLIDDDRQWFKSHHGLDAKETPRNVSFCGHAINQDGLFEINDAFRDDRFSDNPLTTGEPNVVFYAGQPLVSEQGYKLGTLCVIDHTPRQLTQEQKDAMKVLAKHVIAQMELERSNKNLKDSLEKISSQKEELIQSSKMKTLGVMAGGIAHEINNPLGIIGLYSKHIKQSLVKGKFNEEKILEACTEIDDTVIRIAEIVKALQNISRESSIDTAKNVNLKQTIDGVLMLCNEKIKSSGIELKSDLENMDSAVFFDSGQLAQVFINLISNSVDAVEGQKDKWIRLLVTEDDKFMKVSCLDSGDGIDRNDAQSIMDPFFTTKEPGKGTGLGLSISQKIMSQGNGSLTYDQDSLNTKFDVLIPKVQL